MPNMICIYMLYLRTIYVIYIYVIYICYIFIYIYIHIYIHIYIYVTKTELFKSNLRSCATAVVPGTHTDGKVPQKPFRVLSASVLRSKGQCFSTFFKYGSMKCLRSMIFYDIYDMKKLRTGMKWFKIYDLLWFLIWDDPQIPPFSMWSLKSLPSSRTWIYTRDGVTSPMFTRPGQQKTNWNIMEHPAFSSWVNHHF